MASRKEWLTERVAHYQARCPKLSNRDIRRRQLLVSQLTKFFRNSETTCNCGRYNDDLCFDPGCSAFWNRVLQMNPASIVKAIKTYLVFTGEY